MLKTLGMNPNIRGFKGWDKFCSASAPVNFTSGFHDTQNRGRPNLWRMFVSPAFQGGVFELLPMGAMRHLIAVAAEFGVGSPERQAFQDLSGAGVDVSGMFRYGTDSIDSAMGVLAALRDDEDRRMREGVDLSQPENQRHRLWGLESKMWDGPSGDDLQVSDPFILTRPSSGWLRFWNHHASIGAYGPTPWDTPCDSGSFFAPQPGVFKNHVFSDPRYAKLIFHSLFSAKLFNPFSSSMWCSHILEEDISKTPNVKRDSSREWLVNKSGIMGLGVSTETMPNYIEYHDAMISDPKGGPPSWHAAPIWHFRSQKSGAQVLNRPEDIFESDDPDALHGHRKATLKAWAKEGLYTVIDRHGFKEIMSPLGHIYMEAQRGSKRMGLKVADQFRLGGDTLDDFPAFSWLSSHESVDLDGDGLLAALDCVFTANAEALCWTLEDIQDRLNRVRRVLDGTVVTEVHALLDRAQSSLEAGAVEGDTRSNPAVWRNEILRVMNPLELIVNRSPHWPHSRFLGAVGAMAEICAHLESGTFSNPYYEVQQIFSMPGAYTNLRLPDLRELWGCADDQVLAADALRSGITWLDHLNDPNQDDFPVLAQEPQLLMTLRRRQTRDTAQRLVACERGSAPRPRSTPWGRRFSL